MKISMISAILFSLCFAQFSYADEQTCSKTFSHSMKKLHSNDTIDLCELTKGKTVLVVNTASHCGYTKQFKGLETLHQQYGDQGLVMLGFASNDFYQEAANEEEAAKVCFVNFGVSFTMLAPSRVKGKQANPVFQVINEQSAKPSWNFTKYLINSEGQVVERFSSSVRPDAAALKQAIEKSLTSI